MIQTIDELIGSLQKLGEIYGRNTLLLHDMYLANCIRDDLENEFEFDTAEDRRCREKIQKMPDAKLLKMFENKYQPKEDDAYYDAAWNVAEQLRTTK